MKHVINGLLDVWVNLLADIMGLFTGPFWKSLTIAQVDTRTLRVKDAVFDSWLPGVAACREAFVYIGIFIVFLLFMIGILRAFLPDEMTEGIEHPVRIVARTAAAAFAVLWSYTIIALIQNPMASLCEGVYEMGNENGLKNGIDSEGLFSVSSAAWPGGEDFFSNMAGMFIAAVLLTATAWCFIKLVLEMVERYVTMCFLFYVSPIAMSAIASKSTQKVFTGFMRMLFSQYLLIMFNFIFLFVFCYAFSNQPKAADLGEDVGTVLIYYCTLIAWLRLGQRLDEHMSSLGLNAARTGAGLGGELLTAVGMTAAGIKGITTAGAGIGSFGKGLATGKASARRFGGRAGNALHGAAKSAEGAFADKYGIRTGEGVLGRDEGLKGRGGALGAFEAGGITSGAAAMEAARQHLSYGGGTGSASAIKTAELGGGSLTTGDGENSFEWKKVSPGDVRTDNAYISGKFAGIDVAASLPSESAFASPLTRDAVNHDGVRGALSRGGIVESAPAAGLYHVTSESGEVLTYANKSLYEGAGAARYADNIAGQDFHIFNGHMQPQRKPTLATSRAQLLEQRTMWRVICALYP